MTEELSVIPLAPQQRQLWFAAPQGRLGRSVAWVEVRELDEERLERAVKAVGQDHEILRTSYQRVAGLRRPVHRLAETPPPIQRKDLSEQGAPSQGASRGSDDREALLEGLWRSLREPRSVLEDRSAEVWVVHAGEGVSTLLFSAPALGMDTAGLYFWVRAVAEAYHRGGSGLRPPELQYAQVAAWQNATMEQLAEQLMGSLPETDWSAGPTLGLERPAGTESWLERRQIGTTLSEEASARLLSLAEEEGTGPEAVLLAAWRWLLLRHDGGDGLAMSVAVDGREFAEELEAALGAFVTSYAPALELSSALRFRDAVGRVGLALSHTLEEELPVEQALEASEGRVSGLPVCFAWNGTAEAQRENVAGWVVRRAAADDLPGRWGLRAWRKGREIELRCEFAPSVLPQAAAECLMGQLEALLSRAVAAPETSLGELDHRAWDERRWVLEEAAMGESREPAPLMLELWRRRVLEAPEAVAVEVLGSATESSSTGSSVEWTYGELARHVRALARKLRARGIGPEDRVGILTGRTPELLVAVVAVLESGAAYVPLGLADPPERIRRILASAEPELLLVRGQTAEAGAALGVPVETVDLALEVPPGEELPGSTHREDAAYVLFTSGSTGTPKGVVISHGALASYLRWCGEAYPLGAGETVVLHSPESFDLVVTSLLAPLAHGARVLLVPEDPTGGDPLAEALARRACSLLKLTPTHLRALRRVLPEEQPFAGVGTLVLGGEAVAGEAVAPWREADPRLRVINEYGPTEATVGCSVHELAPGKPPFGAPLSGALPIGRPIPGTRAYALDADLEPVAVGMDGELYLGGEGLARGYLGQPGQTAERFVPDPFAKESGARLYRSGDLARWLPGAGWVHRGRIDGQLKVRGMRVEPGEVEAVLERHPGVERAVVGQHEGRLAAWIVAAAAVPAAQELETYAATQLPASMVPGLWSFLDRLPVAASGKVDRKALPEPGSKARGQRYRAPVSAAEGRLVKIWQEVLGVEAVGVDDGFFELGGDSILSTQVVYRARQAGLEITVRQLVQHPTVAQLAAVARELTAPDDEAEEVWGSAPLTPIQRWFFELPVPDRSHWNMAVWLRSEIFSDNSRLEGALQRLRQRHPMLAARFLTSEDGWRQEIQPAPDGFEVVRYEVADLAPGQELDDVLLARAEELQRSLDLAAGRVMAAATFHPGSGEPSLLLLVIHHLVTDGVSWRLLLQDLAQELEAEAPPPADQRRVPQGLSYRRWALRLEQYAGTGAVRSELPFWLEQGAGGALPLPRDFAGDEPLEATAQTVLRRLDEASTQELLETAPAAYRAGVEDFLVTALVQVVAAWSGQNAVLLELEGHGREPIFEDLDPAHTVGWFTSLFPLRFDLGGDGTYAGRLKTVKEQLRRVPHRGLCFGLLRYYGSPEDRASLARLPRPELSFNYLGRWSHHTTGSLELISRPVGHTRDGAGRRPSPLTVTAGVVEGRLEVTWTFSTRVYQQTTVARLADALLEEVRALLAHCGKEGAGGATPSDFPESGLDQAGLDDFLADLGEVSVKP
ncbi:MAG: amino acid adenylation domain-containing protein [Acidobacteriota bacterium]|nr:amino acid adenylation domain-containing protein [Acidobacteriota bacterium]